MTPAARDGIDARVVSAVINGCTGLIQIRATTKLEERVIDRSLQRLRKIGLIRFERGGPGPGRWVVR